MTFSVPSPAMSKAKENKPYIGTSVFLVLQKIKNILCEVFDKVTHYWMNVNRLLNTNVMLICLGDPVAMTGILMQKDLDLGLEAQGRPVDLRKATMEAVETSDISMSKSDMVEIQEVVLLDWLNWDCEEEEKENEEEDDDDDDGEDTEDEEEQNEDDSDWSDEEDDGEMSTESTEAWESFFNNDPFNPFKFCCPTAVKTNASETAQISTTQSSTRREEKPSPEQSTKKGTKKVRFCEEVTVHHMVECSSTSREARDGSCWLEMARDRDRFRRRVERVGKLISPCLEAQNRARAWDRIQRACQSKQS